MGVNGAVLINIYFPCEMPESVRLRLFHDSRYEFITRMFRFQVHKKALARFELLRGAKEIPVLWVWHGL